MEGRSKKSFSKKGKALIASALFVLFFSGAGLYYFVFAPDWAWLDFLHFNAETPASTASSSDNQPLESDTNKCPDCYQRWLDGVPVLTEAEAEAFPVAVVIDNDVLARPQESLSKASLVYEAPVEGGMTRYLAIFPADIDLSAVGPVRSARPYFVAWAAELKALFIHCGGSPEALSLLNKASLYDLNEFYNGNYFWRDQSSSRVAPHNVLISADNWRSYLTKRGLGANKVNAWLFKTETELSSIPEPKDIKLRFSANFQALWRYQAEPNTYQRFFNGVESSDGFGPIQAKNIIIQEVDSEVLDAAGRLKLNLSGTGKAKICLDGECRSGSWRQRDGERTRYYYENGEEIKLNPGVTWIEVADSDTYIE